MKKNETEIEQQLRKELAFDQYGRYAVIRDIINTNRKDGKKFRVLDVGGRGNIMKKFLPDDDVFYLDPLVDTQDENYIEGDGCAMPLEDESFDWVVSADVFEHIPGEKRTNFLMENVRVAKFGMILVAPFYSKEVEAAENNANEGHKILHDGREHIWLKEHIEIGLPEEKNIEDFIMANSYDYQKLCNNRLFLWQILLGIEMLSETYAMNKINIDEEFKDFNYFYNSEVYPYDFSEPSYRKIYFIKKDGGLKNFVYEIKPLDDILFLNILKSGLDIINKIYANSKYYFIPEDKRSALLAKKLTGLNEKLIENQGINKKLNKELIENQGINKKLNDELIKINKSLSWRLTSPLRMVAKIVKKFKNTKNGK